ncbi:MAG TPA: NADH-quinone oxidoreductase subunit L [Candidatus Aminicenantes bacterium]|nr:NADH-quinone oxidoreductase subunit L [Candidatus Aminicenantes bacterium]HRY65234.1 NADH-quinone oxidoreductase subunit L [Candidatus Aminicenantes bacterium]HRZ72298.1 NADH-quinone oxidoreductase subunit L [Candidatus Aminicenantes bacterium]
MDRLFWLVPLVPGASALLLMLFGRRYSRRAAAWQACGAVLVSFVLAAAAFARLAGGQAALEKVLPVWISAGSFEASFSLAFDRLAAVMALVVTGVGSLVHVYSTSYMADDKAPTRYFAFLNLFTFFMLVLVLASDIVLMFVGWEGVGLCSYLLIGFWFDRPAAARAGLKAFVVNRVGDAAFLVGLLVLLTQVGSSSFAAINGAARDGRLSAGLATLAAILLFAGATGKSAQIPLHVWLPDAMEGPTPVSALIHAATMVTAGVYLVCRLNGLFAASPAASAVVAWVGAVTAAAAAALALVQNDIKRVLAYSTISQIGYMFIGCGVGATAAGLFHLTTHAFFKSLLFLAAGSVIHALGGEQDMRRMGGLRRRLPLTFPAFLVGALAISGVPFLSGFFSKDAILTSAFAGGHYVIYGLGLAAAVLTAFYMFRLVYLTFYGPARMEPEAGLHIHESPRAMTVPLIILAVLAAVSGLVGLRVLPGEPADLFGRFLEQVLPRTGRYPAPPTEIALILAATASALLGIGLAFLFYRRSPGLPARLAGRFPGAYRLLVNGYYVDAAYDAVVVRPLVKGAGWTYRNLDLRLIDGALNGSAAGADLAGRGLSAVQSGLVRDYALAFLLGTVIFLGVVLL